MEAFQERVIEEEKELAGKIRRLDSFVESGTFEAIHGEEQDRMLRQLRAMRIYCGVLGERIYHFK